MILTPELMQERLAAFPNASKRGDSPLCCRTHVCKAVSEDIDPEKGTADITAMLTTEAIDSDREVVVAKGLDPTYFEANRMIFADHYYDTRQVVGKLRQLFKHKENGEHVGWSARIAIAGTDIGRDVLTIVQDCGQIGFSIGFFPEVWGSPTPEEVARYSKGGLTLETIIRKAQWFEASATPFPCNVTCQGTLEIIPEVREKSMATLDRLLTKGRIGRKTAAMYGLTTAEPRAMLHVDLSSEGEIHYE